MRHLALAPPLVGQAYDPFAPPPELAMLAAIDLEPYLAAAQDPWQQVRAWAWWFDTDRRRLQLLLAMEPTASTAGLYSHSHLLGTQPRSLDLLPASQLQLGGLRQRLERRADRYRVLLHQAWYQELLSDAPGSHVLIEGGNRYGSRHELEGSIHLYRKRFSHLSARLWLNRFANREPASRDVLILPESRASATTPTDLPGAQDRELEETAEAIDALPPWQRAEDSSENDSQGPQAGQAANVETEVFQALLDQLLDDGRRLARQMEEPFVLEQVVVMEQQRRMRSGELHYFDHPLLKILAQVRDVPDTDQP